MTRTNTGTGGGLFGIIALGLILVLMGVPFVGMAVMMAVLTCNSRGIPLAVGILVVVYLISDFTGALIAASGAGTMAGALCMGRTLRGSVSMAGVAAAICSIFGTMLFLQHSLLSYESMETLVQLYRSAGMTNSEIMFVIELLLYLLPALLALWAFAGVITAGAAARMIGMRRGSWPEVLEDEPLRLGLTPAWILILALTANLSPAAPAVVKQAGVNVAIFMILPYSAVGMAVFRRFLLRYPQMLLVTVLTAVIFPPIAIGALALTGVLDTWLDLRARIDAREAPTDRT
jgi:hypothetical protein